MHLAYPITSLFNNMGTLNFKIQPTVSLSLPSITAVDFLENNKDATGSSGHVQVL